MEGSGRQARTSISFQILSDDTIGVCFFRPFIRWFFRFTAQKLYLMFPLSQFLIHQPSLGPSTCFPAGSWLTSTQTTLSEQNANLKNLGPHGTQCVKLRLTQQIQPVGVLCAHHSLGSSPVLGALQNAAGPALQMIPFAPVHQGKAPQPTRLRPEITTLFFSEYSIVQCLLFDLLDYFNVIY